MAARSDSVLYYGKVEKIGADGSSLQRGLFVTPSTLLVCLPAGGVTRTIQLSALQEVAFTRDMDGRRCSMRVQSEPPLVVDFARQIEADAFVNALSRVAGHVRIARRNESAVRIGGNGSVALPQYSQEAPPRRGVRFADPPVASSPEEPMVGVRHRMSSPSASVNRSIPLQTLENVPRAPSLFDASQHSPVPLLQTSKEEEHQEGRQQQQQQQQQQQKQYHTSPFRREMAPHALGSPEKSFPLYGRDPTGLFTVQKQKNGSSSSSSRKKSSLQRDGPGDLRDVHATPAANAQEALLADLEVKENIITQLRSELKERNDFIDDLKTALRAQEGAFQEMLKVTEQLRQAEASRAELEKQVQLLRAEVRRLESTLQERDESHSSELATKLTQLREAHTTEVDAVREAFAQYDKQMSEYVEKLTADHEREGRKWQDDQRILQKLVEEQRQEIAELTDALAGPRHIPFEKAQPYQHPLRVEWGEEARTQRNFSRGNSEAHRRAATPHAALSTPALEDRLASLAESRARDRLREKLSRYAKGRRRQQRPLGRSGHDDESGEACGEDCYYDNDYDEEAAEEEGQGRLGAERSNGLIDSSRLLTPRVSREVKTASLISPVGGLHVIRNRAIL